MGLFFEALTYSSASSKVGFEINRKILFHLWGVFLSALWKCVPGQYKPSAGISNLNLNWVKLRLGLNETEKQQLLVLYSQVFAVCCILKICEASLSFASIQNASQVHQPTCYFQVSWGTWLRKCLQKHPRPQMTLFCWLWFDPLICSIKKPNARMPHSDRPIMSTLLHFSNIE